MNGDGIGANDGGLDEPIPTPSPSPSASPLSSPAPSSSSSRRQSTQKALRPRTIYFRFGSRIVGATGSPADTAHPNVLRLSTIPTMVESIKQKEYWENEFELEKAAYEILKPLQGRFIPIYFGQIDYDNTRALLLSDIGGACLATLEGAVLRHDELQPLLEETLTALVNAGVSHDDLKLDNFHLVENDRGGDRIIAVDLQRVDMGLSGKQEAFAVKCAIDLLMQAQKVYLERLEHDGLL
ncbi:hypothetical protein B0J15DRAFT_543461 [Fusarium solani]|uniref:Protein kinase domain-containing protein n=1 Tax=Fusarium solani TaxID=169388 RepID=A0A9P9L2P2_FUSSL|nr:uncharacterized protein B0J15DRAFT_543461 [Fusarium solani]KAH7272868.1 hypothetical protein B0J15DRAFT_543461 [Fusarium solani]